MSERILFLGASYFQIPPIKYAKEQNYYVITCDYLPANPGHQFADEYHNINATDYYAVLELAKQLKIDGIVAYASDPLAPIAAYVAEQLGLPGNPYESVLTLARKDLFRPFLTKNNFNCPKHQICRDYEEIEEKLSKLNLPFLVKPVDSSGSKGVSVVYNKDQLYNAFDAAKKFSREGSILLEEYIEKDNYQIAGDGFIIDGNLKFRCFANEHFDYKCDGLVPIGESFPFVGSEEIQNKVHDEIQKVLTLLGMKQGALNFDIRIDKNNNVYIMEIGPRNGGNLIPEVTYHATGIDMIKHTVEVALGHSCNELLQKYPQGYYASYMMHTQEDGIISEFYYSDEIKHCIIEENRWYQKGDKVSKFMGSNCTLGTQILNFSSQRQMLECMDNMESYQKIYVV